MGDAQPDPQDERVAARARSLEVEQDDVADPEAQAEAMLADSDERTDAPSAAEGNVHVEHRTSDETTEPI